MQRRTTIELPLPPADTDRLLRDALDLDEAHLGALPGDVHASLEVTVLPSPVGSRVSFLATQHLRVPFFGLVFGLVDRYVLRRGLRHTVATANAVAAGEDPPPPIKQIGRAHV